MALLMQKAKEKKKAAEKAAEAVDYSAKVDRLAEISSILSSVAPLLEEQNRLKAELREAADKLVPADQPYVFAGETASFIVEPRSLERTIPDTEAVKKAIGKETFFRIAKISMADADKYLSDEEKAKLLVVSRTGPRKGRLVPKS
jgi:hypothetical protein